MSVETLAAIIAPFAAVLTATAWLHGTIASLREQIAALLTRVAHLEAEVDRLRNHRP
mgnify:FL=1|jgi:outer membrane murein-binding lipoprotein Lpp